MAELFTPTPKSSKSTEVGRQSRNARQIDTGSQKKNNQEMPRKEKHAATGHAPPRHIDLRSGNVKDTTNFLQRGNFLDIHFTKPAMVVSKRESRESANGSSCHGFGKQKIIIPGHQPSATCTTALINIARKYSPTCSAPSDEAGVHSILCVSVIISDSKKSIRFCSRDSPCIPGVGFCPEHFDTVSHLKFGLSRARRSNILLCIVLFFLLLHRLLRRCRRRLRRLRLRRLLLLHT